MLTIKEVVAYYPYKVQAILSDIGRFNLDSEYRNEHVFSLCTIEHLSLYDTEISGCMKVNNCKNYSFDFESLEEITLALRQLSDLVNEIEHNGEMFVPIKEIKNLELYSYNELKYFVDTNFTFGNIESLSFQLIQKLLEWHFDIFNLIPRGLAIDLNTISQFAKSEQKQ